MNAPIVQPEIDQQTWNRYRANLPRHLMGIARHLQSVSEALSRSRQSATQTLAMVSEAAVGLADGADRVGSLVGECDLQVRATDVISELVDRVRTTAAS